MFPNVLLLTCVGLIVNGIPSQDAAHDEKLFTTNSVAKSFKGV